MMPLNGSDESSIFFTIGLKIAGIFLSFVGGIVTATWVVASKVKGLDDKIDAQSRSQEVVMQEMKDNFDRFDNKLDRLHDRVDNILFSQSRKKSQEDPD